MEHGGAVAFAETITAPQTHAYGRATARRPRTWAVTVVLDRHEWLVTVDGVGTTRTADLRQVTAVASTMVTGARDVEPEDVQLDLHFLEPPSRRRRRARC